VSFAGAGLGLTIIVPRLLSDNSKESSVSETPQPTETPTTQPSPSASTTISGKLSLQTFSFQTAKVDTQGNIISRPKLQAKYFVEDLGNGVTLEMVQIPSGTFMMGSPPEEAQQEPNESPQHQVKVPGFFMGKYEITQSQYRVIMLENPSRFKGNKRPVEQVSWNEAVEFCKKLSLKTGRKYRLPSEAEWEYACRAGTTTPFYFGETITTDLANYRGTDWINQNKMIFGNYGNGPKGQYREQTTDVDKFSPNAFGLYDMHGNVWEWCQDHWHDDYNGAPQDGSAWTDDNNNEYRSIRGGSCLSSPEYCRSASRHQEEANASYNPVGFRVVLMRSPLL
jgi:formylglycine-generating enzyme required for sulfatase activity